MAFVSIVLRLEKMCPLTVKLTCDVVAINFNENRYTNLVKASILDTKAFSLLVTNTFPYCS